VRFKRESRRATNSAQIDGLSWIGFDDRNSQLKIDSLYYLRNFEPAR